MEKSERKVLFKSQSHKEFFEKYLQQCRSKDTYHASLIYCLGIDSDTRSHVNDIYDFKTGLVKTECLNDGWQTSGSQKIIRMAYNLYNNGTPSVFDYENTEEQLAECGRYTVEELFCCDYAPYFWQAVKIRYPEYCGAA